MSRPLGQDVRGVMQVLPLWTLPAGHSQEGYWMMSRPLWQVGAVVTYRIAGQIAEPLLFETEPE